MRSIRPRNWEEIGEKLPWPGIPEIRMSRGHLPHEESFINLWSAAAMCLKWHVNEFKWLKPKSRVQIVIKFNYLKPEMRMPNQAPSAGKFRPLNFLSGRQGASSGHCDDSLDCDLPLEGSWSSGPKVINRRNILFPVFLRRILCDFMLANLHASSLKCHSSKV